MGWRLVDVAVGEGRVVVSHKGEASRQGFKQHYTEGVDICPSIDRASLALFRRHIFWCPNSCSLTSQFFCASKHFSNAKVREDRAPGAIHQDVNGLDIAVDNAIFMCI